MNTSIIQLKYELAASSRPGQISLPNIIVLVIDRIIAKAAVARGYRFFDINELSSPITSDLA